MLNVLLEFIGGLGLHGSLPLFQPKIPRYMEEANLDFMRWGMNWIPQERKI